MFVVLLHGANIRRFVALSFSSLYVFNKNLSRRIDVEGIQDNKF